MSRHGWLGSRMGILGVGLCLWIGVPERAEAFQIFAASEVQEAHTLRQRILTEVPQLDPRQLREHPSLPPETLSSLQQRLAALQTREANNPFYHWAQAEVLRQMQGDAAAAPAFDRARQTAGPRAMIHWLLWLDFLGRDLRNEALREERALQAIQLTWGLSRFPLLARELIQQGTDAAAAKDLPRAQALFEAAAASAPESPEALIGRASVRWQVDKTRLLQAARDLGRGLYFAFRNVHTGFRLTGNLLLSLLIAWLLTLMLVGAIFSLKAQPLFAHELKEGLLSPFPPAVQGSLGLLAFLLPFFLSLGVLWTAVLALVLSAPYLTRREQWTVSVLSLIHI